MKSITNLRTFAIDGVSQVFDYLGEGRPKFEGVFQYLMVCVLMGVALWVRLAVAPLDAGLQYLTLFPAVTLSAVIFGFRAGLFAVFIGICIATFIFVPPYYTISLHSIEVALWSNTVFLVDGLIVSLAVLAMHRYQEKLAITVKNLEWAGEYLRDSQADLHRAQSMGNIGNWRLDVRHNQLHWSDENYRIFGIPVGNPLTYENFLSIVYPDDRDYVDRMWQAALHGEPYDIEHRIIVNGAVRYVRENALLEFGESGELLGGFGTTQDITQSRLREMEYQRIIQTTSEGFWFCDTTGRILEVNDSYCRMVGYTREEMLKMRIQDIEASESPQEVAKHIQRIVEVGHDLFETRHRRKNGELIDFEISVNRSASRNDAIVVFARDITDRVKRNELRLIEIKQQRDVLIREVHHRIKNNLQGVVGLLRQHVSEHPNMAEVVDVIIGRIYSIAIIHGLQAQEMSEEVGLSPLMNLIIDASGTAVEYHDDLTHSLMLSRDEAVPIALVLNELFTNAGKHRSQQSTVVVKLVERGSHAIITLSNSFDARLTDELKDGQGLSLVRSLLPRKSAILTMQEAEGVFTAELDLAPPVVIHKRVDTQ